MPASTAAAAATETREQRIEAIMKELRPKIEETVRHMVERAVDVPEAEEFGAIDFEFRDAGLKLANEVRQASVASRKKRGTSGCSLTCPALPVCRQVSLVSAAAGRDGAWRSEGASGPITTAAAASKVSFPMTKSWAWWTRSVRG